MVAIEEWFESRVAASYRCHRKAGETGQARTGQGRAGIVRPGIVRAVFVEGRWEGERC